jgi:uncharacterized protein YfaS (alpha-2-macroglobulin family)
VLDAFVVPLSGREPVITLPIKADYAPNVFVSALVVRGRVGGVQPTALVDLGRPAHKLGITELRVGWRAYELKVTLTPDQQVYHVREKARVKIRARTAAGGAPPAGSEVALAAVDEGLLELARNPSWDLLDAMMRRRPYLIETSTAQGQVIGRRHFGLKALPQGGGGGRQGTRELFDTLLLWKARVPLDEAGEATVEVPLNDSLTSFRIVAVATGGVSMFGTGRASIRSTQDLMVLPGIAPLAREGDRMRPEVTLRNASDKMFDVTVNAKGEGLKDTLSPQSMTLAAGEARVVGWDVTVPIGISAIKWDVGAVVRGGPTDRVRVTQQVISTVPVRTYQATLTQWDGVLREPVERPADALPGRGDVQVQLRASLVEGMSGVRDWMRDYPYHCLEQDVSRAVALRDRERWRSLMASLPSYQDSDGLLKYFPTMDWGSEVLTSYVLAIANEAGYAIPDGPRGRMEQGLRKFITGRITRRPELATADLSIRKLQAVEALSRYGKADVGLLASITVQPNLWPTSAVLDWWSVLSRMTSVPDRARRLAEAEQIVRSRLNMQGHRDAVLDGGDRQSLVAHGLARCQRRPPRSLADAYGAMATGRAAPHERRARSPASRGLGTDACQCLGRARGREVLGRLREDGGDRHDHGRARAGVALRELGQVHRRGHRWRCRGRPSEKISWLTTRERASPGSRSRPARPSRCARRCRVATPSIGPSPAWSRSSRPCGREATSRASVSRSTRRAT